MSPKPPALDPQEKSWIEACQNGDVAAFEGLYNKYHRQLYGYLLAMLRSPHAAEDVTQDIFVKLFHNIGSYRFQSPFNHWLFRLARNQAIDHLRREKVRRVTSLDEDLGEMAPMRERVPDKRLIPSAKAEQHERAEQVRAAVLALPEDFREAVVMREWEDLAYEEIAERLEISVGTVKSRLFRARALLEKKLKDLL